MHLSGQEGAMLRESYYTPPTLLDEQVFAALVPEQHYLRRVKAIMDFERYRMLLAPCYSADEGRPADDPVLMVKLTFLQFQYNLSDRDVMAQAQVNVAYRYFLDLCLHSTLPHPSLLSVFRKRLGPERFQEVFDDVVAQARGYGLVKDRVRLKDATHVLASVALPSTIRLVAQMRQRLLEALRPWAPEAVRQAEERATHIRQATTDLREEERLVQRVAHLQEIVAWAERLVRPWTEEERATDPQCQAVLEALALAHKVLADRADPQAGDQVVSVVDPEVRVGKHGHFFSGYKLDVAMDADSEIITALDLLPANADEAANAGALIAHEQAAHGNDVQALSIDSIGWRGDLLRQWQDPDGLGLAVYVPPVPPPAPTAGYTADAFVLDEERGTLRCPGGHTTRRRRRTAPDTGWTFTFSPVTCHYCPLRERCVPRRPGGRIVIKNDYAVEYAAARRQAKTAAAAQMRRQHKAIERKLADVVRWHGGRVLRYRGRRRGLIQYLLTGIVVNIKRLVRLLFGEQAAPTAPASVAHTCPAPGSLSLRAPVACCCRALHRDLGLWRLSPVPHRACTT
jgi:transposase